MKKLRAAVIGVGYFGRFHAQKFAAAPDVELSAVVDVDVARARAVALETGARPCTDYRDILGKVDLVSIAVPTERHYPIARDCLNAGIHILVEKPVTQTAAEARDLIALAEARGLVFQVGHLERYNPALLAMRETLREPVFVESYRMAPYRPRGTDVSVVLDLMTHDLDILLSLMDSEVLTISSAGAALLTPEIDVATARLEFANGCVALVTASRASTDTLRRLHVYQPDAYLSVDYAAHRLLTCSRRDGERIAVDIEFAERRFAQTDKLMSEIRAFVDAVRYGRPPPVSGRDGLQALEVALAISRSMKPPQGEAADVTKDPDHRSQERILVV